MLSLRILKSKDSRAYALLMILLNYYWRLIVRWQVVGAEKVPLEGPVLFVPNHTSNLDPFLIALAVPRLVIFLSKDDIFEWPFVGWLVRRMLVIPIDRRKATDHRALRESLAVLKRGEALCLFPEGTRSRTSELQKGMTGAVLMAARAGAIVVPVGIVGGLESIKAKPVPLLGRRIKVNIGDPFRIGSGHGKLSREEAQRLTDDVMLRIADLLPPDKRGVYGAQPDNEQVARVQEAI